MSRRRLLVVLAVLGIVVLAGCTGGISDTGMDGATATTGAGEETIAPGATTAPAPEGELSVHLLNVGQGSSTLIIGPEGETILIDTGDWRDDGEDVIAYLEAQGVTRIDHLVTTHPDADHIGGHAAVIEHFETNADGVGGERYLDPGNLVVKLVSPEDIFLFNGLW